MGSQRAMQPIDVIYASWGYRAKWRRWREYGKYPARGYLSDSHYKPITKPGHLKRDKLRPSVQVKLECSNTMTSEFWHSLFCFNSQLWPSPSQQPPSVAADWFWFSLLVLPALRPFQLAQPRRMLISLLKKWIGLTTLILCWLIFCSNCLTGLVSTLESQSPGSSLVDGPNCFPCVICFYSFPILIGWKEITSG